MSTGVGVGALDQLYATGPQDAYLIGKQSPFVPHIKTYGSFRKACRDYTLPVDFGGGTQFVLPADADYLAQAFLYVVLPAVPGDRWVAGVGKRLIASLMLSLDGYVMNTLDPLLLYLQDRLFSSADEGAAIAQMSGGRGLDATTAQEVYVPLPLFWTRGGDSLTWNLPVIAMKSSTFLLTLGLTPSSALLESGAAVSGAIVKLQFEQMFVSSTERARAISTPTSFLFEQTQKLVASNYQFVGGEDIVNATTLLFDLRAFTGSTQFMAFTCSPDGATDPLDFRDALVSAQIALNGQVVELAQAGGYFRLFTPFRYFPAIPASSHIYAVSFALRPGVFQPSGEIDFSQLASATLSLTLRTELPLNVSLYAWNYNMLDVANGFASAKFI